MYKISVCLNKNILKIYVLVKRIMKRLILRVRITKAVVALRVLKWSKPFWECYVPPGIFASSCARPQWNKRLILDR